MEIHSVILRGGSRLIMWPSAQLWVSEAQSTNELTKVENRDDWKQWWRACLRTTKRGSFTKDHHHCLQLHCRESTVTVAVTAEPPQFNLSLLIFDVLELQLHVGLHLGRSCSWWFVYTPYSLSDTCVSGWTSVSWTKVNHKQMSLSSCSSFSTKKIYNNYY